MNNKVLYEIILNRLKQEDDELSSLINQGIFYAPELYIAFILGKEIKKNDVKIFGQQTEWIRETNFGNGGPTDFAFKTRNKIYAFELKLRNTIYAYSTDIEKLQKLDHTYGKYFLALIDSWDTEKEKDRRIVDIETKYESLKRVSIFTSFATKQDWYKGQVCCTVGLWELD